MDYAIAIPHLGSVILTHAWDGAIKGLNAFPRGEWPVVGVTFFAFRVMVGLGMLMFLVGLAACIFAGGAFQAAWFHWFVAVIDPAGFLAIMAGWTTTETGRQPWTVQGLLRTADSISPVTDPEVATSSP